MICRRIAHAAACLVVVVAAAGAARAQDAAPATEGAAAKRPVRVAVYDFEAVGADPKLARIVTDAVVVELRKLQRVSVVDMDEVRAMLDLEAQKQLAGCAEDSCLAEIAEALGVDGLVIGGLLASGGENVFTMRRLDHVAGKAIGQVSQRLEPKNGEEFLAMVGPAVEQLFPEHPLRPGAVRGVSPEVALRINPPPLPPLAFWGAAAGTGALLAGAAAAGAFNAWAHLDVGAFTAGPKPLDSGELDRKSGAVAASGWAALGLLGGAAVVGAATGVVALFTDWQGYGADGT